MGKVRNMHFDAMIDIACTFGFLPRETMAAFNPAHSMAFLLPAAHSVDILTLARMV